MSGVEQAVIIDRAVNVSAMEGVVFVAKKTRAIAARKMKKAFCITSDELPPAFGCAGDYLLQDSAGGLFVCDSVLLRKIYEVVE